MTIRQSLALEAVVYANVCDRVMSSCTSDPKLALLNKCFVYNEEDSFSKEYMAKDQVKFDFSCHDPFIGCLHMTSLLWREMQLEGRK